MHSGIYKITCLPSKKFYIGSSNDIKRRWREHLSILRRGIHTNTYLQRSWNKYLEENFKFEIVELVSEDNLIKIEQYYLDKLQSYNKKIGFNLSNIASGNDTNSKDYIVTLPCGKEIEVTNLHKFSRQHNINGGGLHHVARGMMNQSHGYKVRYANQSKEEWQKTVTRSTKLGAGWKGKYKITFPDQTTKIIDVLTKFCKEYNLNQGNMRMTCIGLRKHHKNFKAEYFTESLTDT